MSNVTNNSAFLIAVLGMVCACWTGCLKFILKSRCTSIACCGVKVERDVIPVDSKIELSSNTNNNNNN